MDVHFQNYFITVLPSEFKLSSAAGIGLTSLTRSHFCASSKTEPAFLLAYHMLRSLYVQ
jgi:hypothetical protein